MNGNNFINTFGMINNSSQISVRGRDQITGGRKAETVKSSSPGLSFADELKRAQSEVVFSKHADMRLRMRNIDLSQEQKESLSLAVDRAEKKGLRDTLVMLDNLALVVNVKNRTVVTAMNGSELKQNVFTNIDGAVFA